MVFDLYRDFQCLDILMTSQNNNGKQCKYNVFLHEICLCQFFSVASVFYFSIFEYVGHICTGNSCWMFFIVPTTTYVCVRNMYCTTYALHDHSTDYDLEKQSCHSSIAHVQ